MKRRNRARVLNALRCRSPISRSEIAAHTSLDRKSITNFVSELMTEGLVKEVGKRENNRGRPFTLLELQRHAIGAMGINIAPDRVSGVLVGLTGGIVSSHEEELPFEPAIARIVAAARETYNQLKARQKGPLHGVGVGVPGIIDMEREVIRQSVNIPAIDGFSPRSGFGEFIEEPLYFEEASRAKALAEKWFGLGRDREDFVCIDLDVGVGAGIVRKRELFKGAGEYAGEIGHIIVEKNGRPCRCGNRGCLEAYLSERVLVDEVNRASGLSVRHLGEIDEVTPEIRSILEGAAGPLAAALACVVNLLNPTTIIINGRLMKFREIVLPAVRREMKSRCLAECLARTEVLASNLKTAAVLGAASKVLSDVFEVAGHCTV